MVTLCQYSINGDLTKSRKRCGVRYLNRVYQASALLAVFFLWFCGLVQYSAAAVLDGDIIDERTNNRWKASFSQENSRWYLTLGELERITGLSARVTPIDGRIEMNADRTLLNFRIGSATAICNNTVIPFDTAVIRPEKHILVPVSFLERVLPHLQSVRVLFSPEDRTLKISRLPPTASVVAENRIDTSVGKPPSPDRKSQQWKLRSIIIDPGHGGKDCGAIGPGGLQEKEVVLKIARLLRDELKKQLGVDVVLTRDDDTFLPLEERASIANNNKSDIFLSIHTNSGRRKTTQGFEVFYLNKRPSDDYAQETAALENYGVLPAEGSDNDLTGDVQTILWDLIQNKFLDESSILAEKILFSYEKDFRTTSRGVKQAPFLVLFGLEMPAVLVEVDFISNPAQEKKLLDDTYIRKIVTAIVRGIISYMEHYDKVLGQ